MLRWKKKKKEIEQSRMECIRCITHIAALMVTQKQWRRGAHPGREASDKDPKVDAEVVGVQEEVAGSSRPWDRMGEDTARLMRE